MTVPDDSSPVDDRDALLAERQRVLDVVNLYGDDLIHEALDAIGFFPRISCPECEGRGWVKCPDPYCGTGSDFGWPHDTGCTAECEFCDGSGRIDPTNPGEMP